jgi:hypothetical protein
LIGVHISDETTLARYFHHDHLGSIAVIAKEDGAVVERLSYVPVCRRTIPQYST